MPDWKQVVQKRIAPLRLEPTAESDLVEELAQHLDDSLPRITKRRRKRRRSVPERALGVGRHVPVARKNQGRVQRMPKHEPVPGG